MADSEYAAEGMPPGAYPIVPPLPEHETETITPNTTTATSGTEKKRLSPEQAAAIGKTEEATEGAIQGTEEVRKHKEALAAIESEMAGKTAEEMGAHQQRLTNAIDQGNRLMDSARQAYQQKQAKLDATPTESFFREGDTWGNARRGIGLALSGIGDAFMQTANVLSGHGTTQLNSPAQIIERDLAGQRAHIQRLRDDVVMARTGINDADAARKDLLADVDLKGAAALKRLEALTKARLAAAGLSQPEIDQHQAIIALKQGQAKYQQDYLAPTFENIKKGFEHQIGATTKVTDRTNNNKAPAVPPIVRDPETGKALGLAPTPRAVPQLAETLAQTASYRHKVEDLAQHIEKYGRILDPTSPEAKQRLRMIGEVQGLGRQITGLSSSDAQQKLEDMMIGGSGVVIGGGHGKTGIELRVADPNALRALAKNATEQTEMRLRSELTPLPPQGVQPTQPPPFVPTPAASGSTPAGGAASALSPDDQHLLQWVNSPDSKASPAARATGVRKLRALGVEVQ